MTRGLRCPDCTLAQRQAEDRKRMDRITKATPPATTFDGQLQRIRDRNRAVEAGDVEDLEEDEDDELLDDDGDEVDEIAAEPAEVVHPPAPVAMRPAHRQPAKPPDRVTGDLPWWATRSRDGFTKAAEEKSEEMEADARRRGIKVEGKVNT